MYSKEQEIEHAVSLYGQMGFNISRVEVPLVNSTEGGLILCMDDRNRLHKKLPGGAVPGAFTGLRIVMSGFTAEERAVEVIKRCKENGFTPTTHGDLTKGPLLGCAVRFALIYGVLEGFPKTTAEESVRFNVMHGIPHRILRRPHTARKIALNFNEGTTIEPNGEFFVIDHWVPVVLGARMDKFVNLVAQAAKLVLPRNRNLQVAQ
jgi:hypothetical protein